MAWCTPCPSTRWTGVTSARFNQFQIIDVGSGTVLDTETLSSFSGGVYQKWAISGHVQIQVTSLAGGNAVVSGLFIDPAS